MYCLVGYTVKELTKNKIEVKKCENIEEWWIIAYEDRAYFGSSTDDVSFVASLTKLVKETGKNGLLVFEDMGSIFIIINYMIY